MPDKYRGKPIVAYKIVVNKTGDGLSKAVNITPRESDPERFEWIGAKLRPTKVTFVAVRDDEDHPQKVTGYEFIQHYDAVTVDFVDADLIEAGLEGTAKRIREAEALEKGQLSLPDPEGE